LLTALECLVMGLAGALHDDLSVGFEHLRAYIPKPEWRARHR